MEHFMEVRAFVPTPVEACNPCAPAAIEQE